MFQRIAILFIVLFWLAMTGLLVVRELFPEATRLNAVPPGYVGQLIFQHEQPSDMRIYATGKEAGFLHIQPRSFRDSGTRGIEFNGSISLALPGGRPQPLSWAGQLDLERNLSPARLRLDLSSQQPGRVYVEIDFTTRRARLATKIGGELLNETALTMDDSGFGALLGNAGVDPGLMRQLRASQQEMPKIETSAQTSSMIVGGQKLSTFLFTMKAGGQAVIEAHLSQLGQVLSAQIPVLGWKLTSYSIPK